MYNCLGNFVLENECFSNSATITFQFAAIYICQSLTCSIPLLITSPKRVPFSFVIRPLGASNRAWNYLFGLLRHYYRTGHHDDNYIFPEFKIGSAYVADYLLIGNFPMYNKEFNKVYRLKYEGNVRQAYARYLNLPIEELKNLTIKQLKDGIPVYMGAHIMKFRDTKSGVLDTRLYDYADTLDFETLSKEEALNLRDICMHHAMSFVGVNLVDGVPQRWKIEDSYGDKAKVKGCYVMNDNFFSEFVLSITVDKKYLSAEQLECLKQEPIEFAGDEPF